MADPAGGEHVFRARAVGGGVSWWCRAAVGLGMRGRLGGGAEGRCSCSAGGVGGGSSPDGEGRLRCAAG